MELLSRLFEWVANHEAVLSGIAAAVAIAAVILTLGLRLSGFFRRNPASTEPSAGGESAPPAPEPGRPLNQHIRYSTTRDDVRLAWATAGRGTPLVRSLGWFTNLETEWSNPTGRQFWERLARHHQLIRYDGRGIGLSDRHATDFSAASRLADLETVVDAAGVDRFALMGLSEGGTTAIAYATAHPERVSHLVLYGTFLESGPWGEEDTARWRALAGLILTGWGHETPAFRQLFTSMFLPDGTAEQNRYFNELQRSSASPETARSFLASTGQLDVSSQAPVVQCPTLVMHRSGDLVVPLDQGRKVAAAIPNARLVTVAGNNHWMVLHGDSSEEEIRMIEDFIAE